MTKEEELKIKEVRQTEAKIVKERYNVILKECIAPILKNAGFERKGHNFHLHVDELEWCISIQKDPFGYSSDFRELSFDIEIGITFKEYYPLMPQSNLYLAISCPFRARIGDFTGRVGGFSLHLKGDDNMVKKEVQKALESCLLPVVSTIHTKSGLLNSTKLRTKGWKILLLRKCFPEKYRPLFYPMPYGLLILYHSLGMKKRAVKEIGKLKNNKYGNKEELHRILAAYGLE